MQLYLIRHGESEGNARKLVTGSSNDRLTTKGKEQILNLKLLLNGYTLPKRIITSTMLRTIETSLLLSALPAEAETSAINETDAGQVSEWTLEEFNRQYTDFWTKFDPDRKFPGGESHRELYNRVVHYVKGQLDTENGGDFMMICHGGTISSIFHWAYNIPLDYFSRFIVDNGSLSVLEFTSIYKPPVLKAFNIK